ncbi:MAG: hypothetical protein HZB16_24390 [Armatimonadetes bacterium]|nr:hypothetical protein [Armatimonadota bacterium]
MRTLSRILLALALVGAAATARAELPKNLDEFQKLHSETAKTPEIASKLFLDAICVYMDEKTRDEGRKMIQYMIIEYKDKPNWDTTPDARIFVERLKDPGKQHIFRSYAKGTSPDNAYKMDPNKYELNIEKSNPNHQKAYQVYWKSSGADMSRPVYCKQSTKTELWYIYDHRNIYTDIRPPRDPNAEEFK